MFGVHAVNSETECWPVFTSVDPCVDHVGDQRILINRLGEIVLAVVASNRSNLG